MIQQSSRHATYPPVLTEWGAYLGHGGDTYGFLSEQARTLHAAQAHALLHTPQARTAARSPFTLFSSTPYCAFHGWRLCHFTRVCSPAYRYRETAVESTRLLAVPH